MTNIAFKCDCGWLAIEDPDDLWDDVAQLVDDHVEYCPHNEEDGLGASAKNTTETVQDQSPNNEFRPVENPNRHGNRRFIAEYNLATGEHRIVDKETGEQITGLPSGEAADEQIQILESYALDETRDELTMIVNDALHGMSVQISQRLMDRGFSEEGVEFVFEEVDRGRQRLLDSMAPHIAKEVPSD